MLDDSGTAQRGAAHACSAAQWHAHLALDFALHRGGTELVRRHHRGPLVVQKTLHPEGPAVCQAAIVHPPGGIAGGDRLEVQVDVERGAHAQLVTPGAAKWYRSRGEEASQAIELTVGDRAMLEWLPHESILFDGALARMSLRLRLCGSATAMLWDVVALGRTAAGERFRDGALHQRVEVVRDGALVWVEQNAMRANAALCDSDVGLDGHGAFATLLVAAPAIPEPWLRAARDAGSDIALQDHAVTALPGLLIARARSADAQPLHAWVRGLWTTLRPLVMQREAQPPRLWMT